MIRIDKAVVVEGKYDKIKLCGVIDAPVFTTDGFRIFREKDRLALLCAVAKKTGVIILTDSDSAGEMIRARLKNVLGPVDIVNLYVPPTAGKEKRKKKRSAEGILGVEGIDNAVIEELFEAYKSGENARTDPPINTVDFYEWGLLGGERSHILREELKKRLRLPSAMTAHGLLEAANMLIGREEFLKKTEEVKEWAAQRVKK